MISVHIDGESGFCGGVIRAIDTAENVLRNNGGKLLSLGAIVHNEAELARLRSLGLVTVGTEDIDRMEDSSGKGESLLIRAHGEPPSLYEKAARLGFSVIDCTCPVVLALQKKIREAYARVKALPAPGQVVIFGKVGHAEVLGLVGQVNGDAVVVENLRQLHAKLADGAILADRDIEIFSQTTMSPAEYAEVCDTLKSRMGGKLTIHESICRQVATRHDHLRKFAESHDVIVFVAGKSSSNGKVLFELCKSCNIRSYQIGSAADLKRSWFRDDDSVGVCGATSTPKWLLENVAETIENLQ